MPARSAIVLMTFGPSAFPTWPGVTGSFGPVPIHEFGHLAVTALAEAVEQTAQTLEQTAALVGGCARRVGGDGWRLAPAASEQGARREQCEQGEHQRFGDLASGNRGPQHVIEESHCLLPLVRC